MSIENSNDNTNISFISMLQLLFIALKLTGYITWSWWFVMSPSLLYAVLFFLFIVLYVIVDMKGKK